MDATLIQQWIHEAITKKATAIQVKILDSGSFLLDYKFHPSSGNANQRRIAFRKNSESVSLAPPISKEHFLGKLKESFKSITTPKPQEKPEG